MRKVWQTCLLDWLGYIPVYYNLAHFVNIMFMSYTEGNQGQSNSWYLCQEIFVRKIKLLYRVCVVLPNQVRHSDTRSVCRWMYVCKPNTIHSTAAVQTMLFQSWLSVVALYFTSLDLGASTCSVGTVNLPNRGGSIFQMLLNVGKLYTTTLLPNITISLFELLLCSV